MESKVIVPAEAKKITVDAQGKLIVLNNPIIPFIEGDGIGVDVTPAMIHVVDAAVEKAYHGTRKIAWMEIYTGEKSTHVYGNDVWLPDETLDLIRDYRVAIKCPLTTRLVVVSAPLTWLYASSWIYTCACVQYAIIRAPQVRLNSQN